MRTTLKTCRACNASFMDQNGRRSHQNTFIRTSARVTGTCSEISTSTTVDRSSHSRHGLRSMTTAGRPRQMRPSGLLRASPGLQALTTSCTRQILMPCPRSGVRLISAAMDCRMPRIATSVSTRQTYVLEVALSLYARSNTPLTRNPNSLLKNMIELR